MKRILIVAPHPDDEILGCGGYILSEKQKGSEILVVYGTIGCNGKLQDISVRKAEADKVCSTIGIKSIALYEGMDAMLDSVPSVEIISKIDSILEDFRPDEFFFNYPSRHQDHIKIYECCMATMRLKEGFMPAFVALYEYPFVLNHYDKIDGGRWYHDISENIEGKVKAFEMYESQVKKSPSPLNGHGVKTLASVRGLECGRDYAEMFYIQKMLR